MWIWWLTYGLSRASRRHPQFNIETLPAILAANQIDCGHLEALGGRHSRSLNADASANTDWREKCFRNDTDYAMTALFHVTFGALVTMAEIETPTITRAEALWWQDTYS